MAICTRNKHAINFTHSSVFHCLYIKVFLFVVILVQCIGVAGYFFCVLGYKCSHYLKRNYST